MLGRLERQRAAGPWRALQTDLRIMSYQTDALAAALTTCHNSSMDLYERGEARTVGKIGAREQLAAEAATLSRDILAKLGKTVASIRKQVESLGRMPIDGLSTGRLGSILFDAEELLRIAQAGFDVVVATGAVCTDERAMSGLFALLQHFRPDRGHLGVLEGTFA